MFEKKDKKDIDVQTANKILQNIFEAVDADPVDVSVDKIESKAKSSYRSDTRLIIVLVIAILVTILIPLFFKSSSMFLSVDPNSQRPLTISEHILTEDAFTLTFVGPAVDVSATYAEFDDGERVSPTNYIKSDNKLMFPSFNKEANIYIYDVNGKCLHLLFTPRN